MTQQQQMILVFVLASIMIWLFMRSTKQKRAHEEKMAKIRRDRKTLIEKSKQQNIDKG
ncbi:MAG: hypothetical protein ABJG88_04160 [Litorimonas sp.]